MGILVNEEPLKWEEIVPHLDIIKKHGIEQFISIYQKVKSRKDGIFRWGDETEYTIVKFDHESKKVRVCLRSDEILKQLEAEAQINEEIGKHNEVLWAPEVGGYMIEGTPGQPYGALLASFNNVETNLIKRRQAVQKLLKEDEAILSMSFPALGTADFSFPSTFVDPKNSFGKSIFFPDEVLYQGNPRYLTLFKSILGRRGEKAEINVPIFKDEKTPNPFIEEFNDAESQNHAKPDHIYMDHFGFGFGCCCLQITFQTINMEEAKWLYDQLAPITPILSALSAATPIYRSYLSEVDSRWNIISQGTDDRTPEERSKDGKFYIEKSRYDCFSCYLHETSQPFNDIKVKYNKKHFQQLLAVGVEEPIAQHIAHMFIRDPLIVLEDHIKEDYEEGCTDHFDLLQCSVWNNMRFKPPPNDNSEIGWRVEFRPTEIQLTDFENAALSCFVVLLTRVIISYNLVFVTNISKVNENMQRAVKRDAILNEKLQFRNKLVTCEMTKDGKRKVRENGENEVSTAEMTVNEIINGDEKEFPGLVPLIFQFLDEAEVDTETRNTITQYLTFIQNRASGKISTLAKWMRNYVQKHPKYAKDSYVPDETIYDMIKTMDEISKGDKQCSELLGNFSSQTKRDIPTAVCRGEAIITAAQKKDVAS